MLELKNNVLHFSFPEVHPDARVSMEFQRTLRIPDDGKQYSLPPGLGMFPTLKVDDLSPERIPTAWKEHGGVVIPMFQSEALWIKFTGHFPGNRSSAYPFAIRIATGKVSALTGKVFVKKLKEGDYLVVPDQPWLDGFVVGDGFIRQFVASPLGSGVSVEAQITGEDKVGGIQIEVIPMKNNIFNEKFPKLKDSVMRGTRSLMTKSAGGTYSEVMSYSNTSDTGPVACAATMDFMQLDKGREVSSMSLAAGGKMKQQVFEDKHGLEAWDVEHTSKCFVHLLNSMSWRAVTGSEPPTVPLTSKEYTAKGYPWFDYYEEKPYIKPTKEMSEIKSMKDMPGGATMLPENESVEPKNVKDLSPKKEESNPNKVREGTF